MTLRQAPNPFRFSTQVNLIELMGWKSRNLNELLEHLRGAPGSLIYYHTHHFLKQHQFLSPEPPNDFAYWVTNVLQEDRLGEQLAAIDTVRFTTLKALGQKIMSVIENYLKFKPVTRVAPEGEEFHFMKSRGFVIPTSYEVRDLIEFAEAIRKVSIHSLYHHIFESRLRLGTGSNDFSNWLEHELEETALARALSQLDPYTQTIDGLRQRILFLVEKRVRSFREVSLHAS